MSKTKSVKNQSAPVKSSGKKENSFLPWLLFVLAVTAICLSPMLQNTFTNWDDELYVLKNPLLHGPDWKGIFTQEVSSNYHPFTVLSLALNYQFSTLNPFSYFFVNLLLHVINTALVFYFTWLIAGKKIQVASITALIFGIHPMHVESVAWISERKDVLYGFFFLLSLIQYWKFISSEKPKHYWWSLALFVCSLLSKPAAIILPFVLVLLDYWKGRPLTKKLFLEKIPFLVLSIALALYTYKIQSVVAVASLDIYPFWTHLFFASYGVMFYFIRFIFPFPLSTFHPYPSPDNLGMAVMLSPLFVLALLIAAWYFRKNKMIIFSLLFFIVNLLLVLQLIAIGSTIVSERYTYIPYIGISFLVAMLIEKWIQRKGTKTGWIVLFVISLVFGTVTFARTKVWRDSGTLWTDVINHYPTAPTPRSNRALYLFKKVETVKDSSEKFLLYQQVEEDCSAALATVSTINLAPNQGKATAVDGNSLLKFNLYSTRGSTYEQLHQPEKAKEDYTMCISIFPDNEFAYVNRGAILFDENKFEEALRDFNKAISLNPQGSTYLNRSYCYFQLGNRMKAKEDMETALKMGASVPEDYQSELQR